MLNQYKELLVKTLEEIEAYEKRATKACSRRIRKLSNQIGKEGVHLRKHMISLDAKE